MVLDGMAHSPVAVTFGMLVSFTSGSRNGAIGEVKTRSLLSPFKALIQAAAVIDGLENGARRLLGNPS